MSKALEKWRGEKEPRPVKDYFAESAIARLASGKAHASLGANLQGKTFGHTGRRSFERLAAHGLERSDALVDYGCGTLRMGVHAIDYLGAGLYWGMDVSGVLLEQGRALIGDKLWEEKRPHLRVISAESVAEVAAVKPAMLLSIKVLIHVHPEELPEYVQNIMSIIGVSGQAIVTGKWSDGRTLQTGTLSWLHALSRLQALVRTNGGRVDILKERALLKECLGHTAKSGALRFAHVESMPRGT